MSGAFRLFDMRVSSKLALAQFMQACCQVHEVAKRESRQRMLSLGHGPDLILTITPIHGHEHTQPRMPTCIGGSAQQLQGGGVQARAVWHTPLGGALGRHAAPPSRTAPSRSMPSSCRKALRSGPSSPAACAAASSACSQGHAVHRTAKAVVSPIA